MDTKKNKAQLIKEAQDIASKLIDKKDVITTALDRLDEMAEKEGVTSEHMKGMALIEELFSEYDEMESEQLIILKQIKNN